MGCGVACLVVAVDNFYLQWKWTVKVVNNEPLTGAFSCSIRHGKPSNFLITFRPSPFFLYPLQT